MGIYLNPGNAGFREILNSVYVDKTGLIDIVNGSVATTEKLICVSRPRRFGKSFAAKMLCAYYDRSCDSRELFRGLAISRRDSFEKYLNQFDVIYLDITRFLSRTKNSKDIVSDIQSCVIRELKKAYPSAVDEEEAYMPDALAFVSQETGHRFFIIIDEWDAIFREEKEDVSLQKEYIQFLRGLFKGGPATAISIAGAYMTGILPIKKYGTQSALTDFKEFTMADPLILAEYVGFTENEVLELCRQNEMDFVTMQQWYDGYCFDNISSVYSPNSVMSAVKYNKCVNYWTQTEAYESLKKYISMNMDGLKDAVIAMLGGERVKIRVGRFQNDMVSFHSKDDVLTLLVHLGYLAYDGTKGEAYIPNLEVAEAFQDAVEGENWQEMECALSESERLLEATISGDGEAVASALDRIHLSTSSVLRYNDESSLSCAITIAYYTARRFYTIIRELPAGKGFADLVFLPHRNTDKPAMLVELKHDQSADTAIRQIKENRYDGALKSIAGEVLLVGVSYDKRSKKHTCLIEKA